MVFSSFATVLSANSARVSACSTMNDLRPHSQGRKLWELNTCEDGRERKKKTNLLQSVSQDLDLLLIFVLFGGVLELKRYHSHLELKHQTDSHKLHTHNTQLHTHNRQTTYTQLKSNATQSHTTTIPSLPEPRETSCCWSQFSAPPPVQSTYCRKRETRARGQRCVECMWHKHSSHSIWE